MKTIIIITVIFFSIWDVNAKIVYVEPIQNAKYVSINNNIIIGFDKKIESFNLSSLLSVKGTQSGKHSGETVLTPDKMKIIFKPHKPFAFGEMVEVKLIRLKTSVTSNNKLSYTFQTQLSKPEVDYNVIMADVLKYSAENNIPFSNDSPLPQLNVVTSNNPTPGYLYLSSFRFTTAPYDPYILIARNNGSYNYSRLMDGRTFDFRKQPNGLLTYHKGEKYYAEDAAHNLVDSFACGNGYTTDFHELQFDDNGHAFLISYDPQIVDMSQVVSGGNPNATVYGIIIQELDVNKNVVFQWRSWDHFEITEAIHENLTAEIVDYVHTNAIEVDNDGNIMISSRHLSEITKIDRMTGNIIWRLGGVHNDFTFVNDPGGFSYQHDIRRIANGNITLFDNGNFNTPRVSRAVEYQLDEENKIATKVWQYRHTPFDIYASAMGSAQRLLNGNTLISWGLSFTTITEATSSGVKALEVNLPFFEYTYRTLKDETVIFLENTIAIEGFYNTESNSMTAIDTVTAYLRNIDAPYNVIDSSKSVIDPINLKGMFKFYNVASGRYYISLKHRNSMETWSRDGGESYQTGNTYNFDFTESISRAYGDNLVLKGSKYCLFSGDVNQDGVIDVIDLSLTDNDAFDFVSGYVNSDVDGNNVVDAMDLLIVENNSRKIIIRRTPQ